MDLLNRLRQLDVDLGKTKLNLVMDDEEKITGICFCYNYADENECEIASMDMITEEYPNGCEIYETEIVSIELA